MKRLLSVLISLILFIPTGVAFADGVTLEDYAGVWQATAIAMDDMELDAADAGFDMTVTIDGTNVTIDSIAMGVDHATFKFLFVSSLIYTENSGGSTVVINIEHVDDSHLNLYETVDNITMLVKLERNKDIIASASQEPKPSSSLSASEIASLKAEGIVSSGTDKMIVTDWAVVKDRLVLELTNVTDEYIPFVNVQVVFRDKSDNILATVDDGHDAVLPHATVVSTKRFFEKIDGHSSVEAILTLNDLPINYRNHTDALTIKDSASGDYVYLDITNTAEENVNEVEIAVVFYRNGKIVGAAQDEAYDLVPGGSCILKFSGYKTCKADSYKFFVNQAHSW